MRAHLWAPLGLLLCSQVAGAQPSAADPIEEEEPPLPSGLEEDPEPQLPEGLGDESEPALPGGLDEETEPALPTGLGAPAEKSESSQGGFTLPFSWSLFVDLRAGVRLVEDPLQKRISMGEARLQVHAERSWEFLSLTTSVRADALYDPVLAVHDIDLERGEGAVDLREAKLVASPLEWLDLSLGRQTLTWGTGDLLFINDMFPKDWNAFLLGRDIDYLKAPSDAAKLSAFTSLVNVDLVYTPRFDADRFPDRRRISSWDPLQQELAGRESPLAVQYPDEEEWAGRLHRRLGRYELAAYGYRGFWKSPAGFNASTGEAVFPKLSVYGASARRTLLGGIAHLEGGYYDSRTDRDGDDAFVRNSEVRGLIGFEREALRDLSVGLQYYAEYMRMHKAYERSLPAGLIRTKKIRHLLTMRLRYQTLQQNLALHFFSYLSPSDQDLALMPSIVYSISDHAQVSAGVHYFVGKEDHTFFGQLNAGSNAYSSMRMSW